MLLLFIHGWSVTNTNTYGRMPDELARHAANFNLELEIQHIHLGRYISFHDEVTVDDIARALHHALKDLFEEIGGEQEFSCITHSTGGPVVRQWINRFYTGGNSPELPLRHLVMLAPANHGSSLAALGKKRVGRIKAFFSGIEPGQRVLDWLSLGSTEQWVLNEKLMSHRPIGNSFFPFVLTGQGIDRKLYDFLNDYLVEPGSDGVVRVSGANLNYRYIYLVQTNEVLRKTPLKTYELLPVQTRPIKTSKRIPLGVFGKYSHSGSRMGIMASAGKDDLEAPLIVGEILRCLRVTDESSFKTRDEELSDLTLQEQTGEDRYCSLVFNVHDDLGRDLDDDDFDVILLGGDKYQPNALPKGFFKDRQLNRKSNNLIYYLNADKMEGIKDGKFGIRVVARPSSGFSYYAAAEFRSENLRLSRILKPNEMTYIDITLRRKIDENVLRFGPATDPHKSFKRTKPAGNDIEQ